MVLYTLSMAPTQKRVIVLETWTILRVLLILAGIGFLYIIRDVLALVIVALFLAALIHPAARALARFKIPKGVTVIALYLTMFGIAALAVGLLLPPLIEQSSSLLGSLGKSWNALSGSVHALQDISVKYGLSDNVQAGVQSLEGQVTHAATGLFSTLTDLFGGLVGLIVVLVMTYYMVVQEEEARNLFRDFIPEKYHTIGTTIIVRVEEKIGKWLLGQLSLCLIIGLMYYVGLMIVGINSALVLAFFGGFTEFIPYLGPILGAIPAVIFALSDSPIKALFALGVIIIIQQFEGHIIVPKVMQKAVGINPLVSIIALIVGGKLFGFIGILLAIPTATTVSVILTELYRYSKIQSSSE